MTNTTHRTRHCTTNDNAAPARRHPEEVQEARHYARRLREQMAEERARLPGQSLRLAIREAAEVSTRRTQDAVLDVVADRLLRVLEREREQPLPFDAAARQVERATDEAVTYMRLVR